MQLYWLLPQMLTEEDLLGQRLVEDARVICANLAEAWGQQRALCHERYLQKPMSRFPLLQSTK
jgi:hypothetical protein